MDLEAIELIKQLKARYFRFLDTRDLVGMKSVFAIECEAYFKGGHYEFNLQGWDELEKFYLDSFSSRAFGIHTGHHPEIQVKGTHATGTWYLHDIFIDLEKGVTVRGSALYQDRYEKINGEWQIIYTGYERLFEEVEQRDDKVMVTVVPIQ